MQGSYCSPVVGDEGRRFRKDLRQSRPQEPEKDDKWSFCLTAGEQMGREAVAQRVQRHTLLDPGRVGRLVEQAAQLAGGHRLATD